MNGGATFNGGTDSSLYTPVYLPDGATITSVEFVLRDISGTIDVSARLQRKAPDATLSEPSMASVTSSGSSGE
ncbi:MAG: hypothetical protein AAGF95_18880 [Chloroflexota bacterium]